MLLLCIPRCSLDDCTGSCKLIHFLLSLEFSVLGFHEHLFDCCVTFKVYLYTILTTCLFYTFGYTLCIWNNYLSYCGLVGLPVVAWIAALVVVVVSVSIVVITCVVVVN